MEERKSIQRNAIAYLLLVMVLAALYGMFTDFIPDHRYVLRMEAIVLSLSLVLVVLFYVVSLRARCKLIKIRLKEQGKKAWLGFIGAPFMIFCVLYMALILGFPALIHVAISDEGSFIFEIESKSDSYRRKRCWGGIIINHEAFFKDRLCGIPKDMWSVINPGDSIELIGETSYFGVSYSRMRLIKKINKFRQRDAVPAPLLKALRL